MNYLEFIKKSNLKSVLEDYYQTITPSNFAHLENELEAKHLLLQKIEQFISGVE